MPHIHEPPNLQGEGVLIAGLTARARRPPLSGTTGAARTAHRP
jgi:hypothetical protein